MLPNWKKLTFEQERQVHKKRYSNCYQTERKETISIVNSLGDSIVSPSGVQISLCKLSSSSPRLKVLRCECRHHFVLSVFVALQEMTPEESHKEMLIHLANVIAVSSKRLCF